MTNNGTVTIGSTSLTFSQFSGAGNITAGNGLDKTGSQLFVKLPSGSGLSAGGAGLSIAPGGVTDAMMAASSVDLATDTVTNALTVDHGGTGLTTIAKGSLLVANSLDTITALDGGAANTCLLYTSPSPRDRG